MDKAALSSKNGLKELHPTKEKEKIITPSTIMNKQTQKYISSKY